MTNNRLVIKICGSSGQGINSVGELTAKAIKKLGYKLFGYREYPSLIRGGFASYQIDFSDNTLRSSSKKSDVLISLGRIATHKYLKDLNSSGILIHSLKGMKFEQDEEKFIKENRIKVIFLDAFDMADKLGGKTIIANIILFGLMWKVFAFPIEVVDETVREVFAGNPKYIELDLKAFEAGYNFDLSGVEQIKVPFKKNEKWKNSMIITGNAAVALGSISAGVRAYYSYPMTPSSSILSYHADFYKDTGVLVKQAEDEITAIQMAIGSMFMGTRALVATSGGGFDLMTETISLSGMTETPLVCVIGQRPGPATGLPTWTADGDLNLAIYAGHGEFPRCVIAASDLESVYTLTQRAFDIAEKYQIPVLMLTDKQIAEALFNIDSFPKDSEVKRYLVEGDELKRLISSDRYKFVNNGISSRWLPGSSEATFVANGDEHMEDGSVNEEAVNAKQMMEKRMKKLETLYQELPSPMLYGEETADIVFVGWGSAKAAILDAMDQLKKAKSSQSISYLHFDYIYPLKTEEIMDLSEKARKVVLVENNYSGQLGNLIVQKTGYRFNELLLKYDGRPFFVEDILNYLKKL
ncbi:2-oxoacid:acceptor oxidoreductase subunit alpha [Candidatus Dojkabacteria bacterium]|nr:2-oxoacid:acceptor oxidoreductase subunit alpha [Candidatus Dojkabacteria bacterium]